MPVGPMRAADLLGYHRCIGRIPATAALHGIAVVPADVLANLISRFFKREKCAIHSFLQFRELGSNSGLERANRLPVDSQLSIAPIGQHVEILAHYISQAHRRIRLFR